MLTTFPEQKRSSQNKSFHFRSPCSKLNPIWDAVLPPATRCPGATQGPHSYVHLSRAGAASRPCAPLQKVEHENLESEIVWKTFFDVHTSWGALPRAPGPRGRRAVPVPVVRPAAVAAAAIVAAPPVVAAATARAAAEAHPRGRGGGPKSGGGVGGERCVVQAECAGGCLAPTQRTLPGLPAPTNPSPPQAQAHAQARCWQGSPGRQPARAGASWQGASNRWQMRCRWQGRCKADWSACGQSTLQQATQGRGQGSCQGTLRKARPVGKDSRQGSKARLKSRLTTGRTQGSPARALGTAWPPAAASGGSGQVGRWSAAGGGRCAGWTRAAAGRGSGRRRRRRARRAALRRRPTRPGVAAASGAGRGRPGSWWVVLDWAAPRGSVCTGRQPQGSGGIRHLPQRARPGRRPALLAGNDEVPPLAPRRPLPC